jgi:dynein heavy chain
MKEWLAYCAELGVPTSENYSLQDVLGNVVQIRDWRNKGLPSDAVSINNGILVDKSDSYPLMIDP